MNTMNEWITHLRHPLVLAGFGLFLFALIIKPLFLNNQKLSGTATERLLHKGMILLFILAAMAIAGGLALGWKATPAPDKQATQPTKEAAQPPSNQSGNQGGMNVIGSQVGGMQIGNNNVINNYGPTLEQYEAMSRQSEERILKELREKFDDEKERYQLEQEYKGAQEKLANLQQSYEEELKKRKAADEAVAKMKGQLSDEQVKQARASLRQGNAEVAEKAFDTVLDKGSGPIALAAFHSGQLAEGRLDYEKAIRQYRKAVALDEENPDYLLAAGNMARTVADYAQAQEWLERLLKIREKEKKGGAELALAQNTLAGVYTNQGKYAEAEPLYKRALEIREKKLGKEHPSVATTLDNLAELYDDQGWEEEAEPLYKRALEIREKKLGKEHLDVATTLNNLALLYDAQGRYEEAEPLYKRALSIREQKLGKEHLDVAGILSTLAGLYDDQGRDKEAEPLYKRALEIREKKLGKEHPFVVEILEILTGLYDDQGRYDEAEPLFKRVLAIEEQKLGKDHHSVAFTLNSLAGLYQAQGRYAEAEPLYQRAIAIMKAKFSANNPNLKRFQENYDELKRKQAGQ